MTRPRPVRLLVTLAGLSLALSGCSTLHAGAAAVVGSDRITETQLQRAVARGLADPTAQQSVGQDRPTYQRQVLTRMITHDVLAATASKRGIGVTEGAVDARIAGFAQQAGGMGQLDQQALQNGIALADLRGFIRDLVLREALGTALTQNIPVSADQLRSAYQQNIAQYDQVHSAHILVSSAALAHQLLAKAQAHPEQFAQLAATYSQDTSNKVKGGDLGFAGRGTFVKPFEDAIFAARPGSFVLVHSQFGYHVVHVIERRTTTLAQATPDLRGQLLQQQSQQAVATVLGETAHRLGVHVNPRFGRWDWATETVVAPGYDPKRDVSSPSPAPGAPGGAGPGGAAPGGAAPGGAAPGGG